MCILISLHGAISEKLFLAALSYYGYFKEDNEAIASAAERGSNNAHELLKRRGAHC